MKSNDNKIKIKFYKNIIYNIYYLDKIFLIISQIILIICTDLSLLSKKFVAEKIILYAYYLIVLSLILNILKFKILKGQRS